MGEGCGHEVIGEFSRATFIFVMGVMTFVLGTTEDGWDTCAGLRCGVRGSERLCGCGCVRACVRACANLVNNGIHTRRLPRRREGVLLTIRFERGVARLT